MRISSSLGARACWVLIPMAAALSSCTDSPVTPTRALGARTMVDAVDVPDGPFPSDRFTVLDPSQKTGLRINLPLGDCAVGPSDCLDVHVLNTLDGFNIQPRLSIPFDGPIDLSSINS